MLSMDDRPFNWSTSSLLNESRLKHNEPESNALSTCPESALMPLLNPCTSESAAKANWQFGGLLRTRFSYGPE